MTLSSSETREERGIVGRHTEDELHITSQDSAAPTPRRRPRRRFADLAGPCCARRGTGRAPCGSRSPCARCTDYDQPVTRSRPQQRHGGEDAHQRSGTARGPGGPRQHLLHRPRARDSQAGRCARSSRSSARASPGPRAVRAHAARRAGCSSPSSRPTPAGGGCSRSLSDPDWLPVTIVRTDTTILDAFAELGSGAGAVVLFSPTGSSFASPGASAALTITTSRGRPRASCLRTRVLSARGA